MRLSLLRFACLLLLTTGCARQHFFQDDARLPGPPTTSSPDSVRVVAGRHYQRGALHNVFFGRHYRDLWAMPVVAPVLRPESVVAGGLTPGKLGGGFQSTSLTLTATDGRSYALRTLDKDPYKTLPKALQKTFVLNIVRDATSAINPYGAFVVPPLAEAAGVLHTTPHLFYVRADETGLGDSSARFQGRLAMLEERFKGRKNLGPTFGNAQNLVGSDDVLQARYQQPTQQIDQLAFARARLLDIWLGDWDRHQGQWQWAAYGAPDGGTRYRPIPKDRDQVFYRFDDGAIPWLASRRFLVRKLRTFKPAYEDVEGLVRNAHFIDERALNEVTAEQFQQLAHDLQKRLTDEVIDQALHRMPPPAYAREGATLAAALRARRTRLPAAAHTYYRLLARCVTVAGTDQQERFVVQRLTDSTTRVSVYSAAAGAAASPFYQRTFRANETSRIVLYGLGNEDTFDVSGEVGRGIAVDIFGGPGEDTVTDTSRVRHGGRKTTYHDTRSGNSLRPGPTTRDRTRKGVKMHTYDREGN